MTNVLGLIPARGGSKSIPGKNLVDLGGRPLIAWTIESALNSSLSKVIVSTDSIEIATVCESLGAQV
ncbi:MAG: acylneuraminate cytidylyltransferase family protein, partial [Actinobacteria bacterium]|nr:acylneuraminate cytidylyltransferase family protein [Actinomycetota bacterium]